MNGKRGDFTGLLFLIVSIAAFAIFLLIVGYISPLIANNLTSQMGISSQINNSFTATTNTAKNTLSTVWMIVFGGLLLSLMITAYFVPSHPIFAVPFIILLMIAFMVSIALSNAYSELSANAILSGAAAEQSLIGFIMTNLPLTTLVIGVIVMVISFAKPSGGQYVPA